jgi:small subunit ribosomal protein S1
VDVKILRVDTQDRKIGLSLKRAQWGDSERGTPDAPEEGEDGKPAKPVKKKPSRGGMDAHDSLGTSKITFDE